MGFRKSPDDISKSESQGTGQGSPLSVWSGHSHVTQYLKSNPSLTEWVCQRMGVTRIGSVAVGVGRDARYSSQPSRFSHTQDLLSLVDRLHG